MSPSSVSRSSRPEAPADQTSATTRSAASPVLARTAIRRYSGIGLLLAALSLGLSTGCYYGHLAAGQTKILCARLPIEDVLRDDSTDAALREQLELVLRARAFASGLGLDVGGRYTSYVPWPGDRILTSVVATRPGEVEAAGFRFPIVGEVPYKGFFDPEAAAAEAKSLRARGLDVCVVPVPAYSTLGWLDDPVTGPMLRRPPGELVETLIHELVHATVFFASQPEFNEGVASFVGQEAVVRFYADDPATTARERARVDDSRRLARTLLGFRERVAELYARGLPDGERNARRAELEREARREVAALRIGDRDADSMEALAGAIALNDACLALRGTYAGDVARYAELLDRHDGDLHAFIARLRTLEDADDPRAALFAP